MNGEPTYHFVKGKGWVPETDEGVITKNCYGENRKIIDRQPRQGEMWFYAPEAWYVDGKLDYKKAVDHVNACTFHPSGWAIKALPTTRVVTVTALW